MITIDVDRITDDSVLIILHPTGIKYTAQCGGMSCTHPSAEGYAIPLGDFAEYLNGCDYGCEYLPQMPDKQKEFAAAFDAYAKEETKDWIYKISFDHDRIGELQEGWIPVLLNGKMDDIVFSYTKAFLHNGNCD